MRSSQRSVREALGIGLRDAVDATFAPFNRQPSYSDYRCDHTRFDQNTYKKHSLPLEFKKQNKYMTPEMSQERFKATRNGTNYVLYSKILCLATCPEFPESPFLPDWWTGMKTVTVERGQVGLVKINGKPEFLKPGIYRLPSSVWFGQKSVTESFRHESILVTTVPDGHLDYVKQNDQSFLLGPGMHVLDAKDITHSTVIDPNDLDLKIKKTEEEIRSEQAKKIVRGDNSEVNPYKTELVRICQGKAGLYEINFEYEDNNEIKRETDVGIIPFGSGGVNQIGSGHVFRRRISTKEQRELIETEVEYLNSNNKPGKAKVKAIVSYQIEDMYKIAKQYGLEKDAIENGIKQLAERWVNASAPVNSLIRQPNDEKKAPPAYDHNAVANQELTELKMEAKAIGIKFTNITFTSATLADEQERKKHAKFVIEQIKAASRAELDALKIPARKMALKQQFMQRMEEEHRAEVGELIAELSRENDRKREIQNTLTSQGQEIKTQSGFSLVNQSAEFTVLQLDDSESNTFFNGKLSDSQDHEYLKNILFLKYHPGMFALSGIWRFLPDWLTGMKTITVEEGHIGLIKFRGQPEFLQPGTYRLPASSWVDTRALQPGSVIKHGAMTIYYVAPGELGYAEDHTLRDDTIEQEDPDYEYRGVKGYRLLKEGIHFFNLPTVNTSDVIFNNDEVVVRKTTEELSREEKNKDKPFKTLFINIQEGEAGIFYDENGELGVLKPGIRRIHERWTFYKRLSTQEQTKLINVSTQTLDGITVNVDAEVRFEIPLDAMYDAILKFGPNKINEEITRLAEQEVVKQINCTSIITGQVTGEDSSFSPDSAPPAYSEADYSGYIAKAAMIQLDKNSEMHSGASIKALSFKKIRPEDIEISRVLKAKEFATQAVEESVKTELLKEATMIERNKLYQEEISSLTRQLETARAANQELDEAIGKKLSYVPYDPHSTSSWWNNKPPSLSTTNESHQPSAPNLHPGQRSQSS